MISFVWPWVFVVVVLPLLVYWLVPRANTNTRQALQVPFFQEVSRLRRKQTSGVSRRWRAYTAFLTWVALIVAAAQPVYVGDAHPLAIEGRDLVLAIDISGSMEQSDFALSGQRVTRLGVVKALATDFIERRVGDRIGLVLFGARAYLQTPLTYDRKTVTHMLSDAVIGLAGKQTAIGDAIGLTLKRLKESESHERILILITDGANTSGSVDPLRAAELAGEQGLTIYTIGIGSARVSVDPIYGTQVINPSSDLDEELLKAIAKTTGGAYFRAGDTQALDAIYAELDKRLPISDEQNIFRPTRSLYHWPLAAAFILSVFLALPQTFRFATRERPS